MVNQEYDSCPIVGPAKRAIRTAILAGINDSHGSADNSRCSKIGVMYPNHSHEPSHVKLWRYCSERDVFEAQRKAKGPKSPPPCAAMSCFDPQWLTFLREYYLRSYHDPDQILPLEKSRS